ncbi:MAG: B12-binding domain-containing radical SAM protein [Alphaproteobacteria bacterium]|uniref:B12-binding domain-containing radical SAM protein n=1 Tax=Candidatus Nitrobium versatile TaxID=2884831 RepID=A0A953SHN9_9BACT|nr:B12-binding domain-containing radical SAM protein [Candidatus Nitrobium versatile]
MRCALIIPAWTPEDIFSSKTSSSQINYWQPLGTLYVAAVLRRAGHEVVFLNGAFMTRESILSATREFMPDVIGLYSTTFGWNRAKEAAADLKRHFGDKVFICVGGPYPIAAQERCLEDAGDCIDAVITGEGEHTTLEMMERLERGESLEGIAGLVCREGGRIVGNPPRPLITDLDSLPFPARELLGDAGRYIPPPATYRRKPVAVLITSRGCNRQCIYCFQMDKSRASGIRYRSVENVLQEIEYCLRQGYREIKFIDDTLAADYDRAMHLAKEIKARRLDFTWFASACVNQVDKPLLRAFKEAGCWAILFGAESGVQKNLNTLRKGTTLEQIRAAVQAAKEAGLKVSTPFLFGIPGETFEEGLQTIRFAVDLNPDMANFHAITPFPGTYLHDNMEKYGTMSGELSDFTYQGAAFVPYTMTRDEIRKLRQIAFRSFYGRPSFIIRKVLELRTPSDFKVALKSIRSLFWLFAKRDLFRK